MENLAELIQKLEWLTVHNKNYTKKQYYTIEQCLELAKEIAKSKGV